MVKLINSFIRYIHSKFKGWKKFNESIIEYSQTHKSNWVFIGNKKRNMEIYKCPLTNLFWVIYNENDRVVMRPARTYPEIWKICEDMERTFFKF